VGGVVDGDYGVGDGAFCVGPAVALFDSAERGSFDEFEGGLQMLASPSAINLAAALPLLGGGAMSAILNSSF
jgi:hypothetical protein